MNAEQSAPDLAHAARTKRRFAFYDWWVLGVTNQWIWKCRKAKFLELYRGKRSGNHLEVGVGTGYFLRHSLTETLPCIALLDINRDFLDHTARRIEACKPEIYQNDVLEPLHLGGRRFDSIAINSLLHSLPGALEVKAGRVCDQLLPFLENDGVLFGSTILGKDIQRPLAATWLMRHYNRKGAFSNSEDSLGGIMESLSMRFKTFNVEVCGCVVLFWGEGLRDGYRHEEPAS